MKTLFVFAHKKEASFFLQNLKINLLSPYKNIYYTKQFYILISGGGLNSSFNNLNIFLKKFYCEVFQIINFGIAGSLKKQLLKNEIYQIAKSYVKNKEQVFDLDFKKSLISNSIKANCVSTSVPLMTSSARQKISPLYELVDMELYSVCQVAKNFNKPISSFKLVSDFANGEESYYDIVNKTKSFSKSLWLFFERNKANIVF